MLPIEKNARRLVGVLVQHFPTGAITEDLRRQFERDTGLARQSFYNCLKYAKQQGWFIGGRRDRQGRQDPYYNLNPDGCWKEPRSTGEAVGLDKDQLEYLVDSQLQRIAGLQSQVERLRDWSSGSNGEANIALSSLVRIVSDSTASVRQRLKAASAILAYQVPDMGVVEFTKRFLESVCASTDISNVDYKVEAAELLRRHEAPRIASESVRPSYRESSGTEAERVEAWRVYERWQLRKQIVLSTKNPPTGDWDHELMSYEPPAQGWPPVRVVRDPASGYRLLDNLMPGFARISRDGSNDSGAE
jgi:hypothetical protein